MSKQGVLVINKPQGMTSFDVLRRLKKVLHTKEIGHAGTLDPIATGVMVVLVGSGVKLSSYLLENDKTYVAGIFLGATSDTFDSTGKVTYLPKKELTLEDVKSACEMCVGTHDLTPPAFSAIHVNGVRAYDLARRGEEVVMAKRPMTLMDYEIIQFKSVDLGYQLTIKLHVSKGTYIRSIAYELGKIMDCGGLMNSLMRTASGPFTLEDSYELDEVTDETELISNCEALMRRGMTIIPISEELYKKVNNGQYLSCEELKACRDRVALSYHDDLVGIYDYDSEKNIWKVRRIWKLSI